MNLRQLQYFIEVSEIQSVTKAATRLNLAQPALTRHIRTLERDLGVQLFSRSGRGIALTTAGAVFRDRVKSILRDLDRARLEVQALSRSPGGRIDIGMPASLSQALTRVLVQRVGEQLPKVAVRVIDGWTGFIVEWLLLGRLDLGVIYDHALRSNLLAIEPLAMEQQFLVCAAGDPLAGRSRSLPLETVAKLPLALPSREHGLRIAFEQQMRAVGLSPTVELELESVIAIKQFVAMGGIYTILPFGEIGQELSAARLVAIRTRPALERTLSLAWARDRTLDEPMQALHHAARDGAADRGGRLGNYLSGPALLGRERVARLTRHRGGVITVPAWPWPENVLVMAPRHLRLTAETAALTTREPAMEIVDLSREIFHRTHTHPSHPPVIITVWNDHNEKVTAGKTTISSKALSISFSDHAGTHVDAPIHFDDRPGAATIDQIPLENFYTSAICLDLSHVPLKHAITVPEMEEALAKSGEEIRSKDTVLIYMATNDRLLGSPRYVHDFPGLALESVHWLADKGIGMFGVEAVSPSPEGELNFQAHRACAERGITHMECLANLDKVVGRGRFRFAGFPLKIRGGTASPIRAVAIFE